MNIDRKKEALDTMLSKDKMEESNKDRYICADDKNSCGLLTLAFWLVIVMTAVGLGTYFALLRFFTSPNQKASSNEAFLVY